MSSQSTVPEQEASIWLDEKEEQQIKRQALNDAFDRITGGRASPLQSTLNTEWDDISSTQQKYYLRKAKEMIAAALSVVTPGQERQLWESLRRDTLLESETSDASQRRYFDAKSDPIAVLIEAHNQAQSWQTKRQILSLFANDFSRSELQRMIPSLSKWRIDQARDHATKTGRGQPVEEKQIFRTRIDSTKVDHFLDFISRPELLQDVAFGTKTLRLDSGERITIPAAVRKLIPSRIIEQYTSYCQQQEFEPAAQRSLYRMLDVCSASMQKSLQGLDNITAEGTEGVDNLIKIVDNLVENGGADEKWGKTIQREIKEIKRYFKTDFKAHIGREENCADHCSTYSLSDPKYKEYKRSCNHKHDVECERCVLLEHVLRDIKNKTGLVQMDEQQRSMVKFDFEQCETAIYSWKAHLLRTIVQDEAKQEALSKLDQQTCLIVCDWAMKFLPLKYRENMSEFFGKRGLSWHVSAVITKNSDHYNVECFVHLINSCPQNNYAVACIYEHLFNTIKAEYPTITQAYLRSDNAACYHNGPLLLCLQDIGKRSGISPIRYDFSDPQSGKDICDRKIAPMKAHIRRFVNENHNVVSSEDMKTALESHGGLKGCRAAVVEVDSSKDLNEENKIPGISLLYNFKYEVQGIRVWKAYEIGTGKLLNYKDLHYQRQELANLKVIEPFGSRQKECGTINTAAGKTQAETFSCSDSTCVLTFRSEREAQAHMDTGKHIRELESVSLYDQVRKKWAERLTGISTAVVKPTASTVSSEEPDSESRTSDGVRTMGWALKTTKKRKRIEEKVKTFLINKFQAGEISGNKADPLAVSREMKFKKDEDGNLFFQPEEWKTAQQIKSFFSRHSAVHRQKLITETRLGEQNEEELTEEDNEAWEAEGILQDLRVAIYNEIQKPEHPILVEEINICQLSQAGKLNNLKIEKLKTVCSTLGLHIQGSQARKKSFLEPLEELVMGCTCRK